jgi:putative transposase
MTDNELSPPWQKSVREFTGTRRNLPHLQLPGSTYFTTSATDNRQVLSEEERDVVMISILFHNEVRYELSALVVMPDHFHLLIEPLQSDQGDFNLSSIFHSIKSFSAREILRLRKSPPGSRHRSQIWQEETYEYIIRNEQDYLEKFEYILRNPVKAGLVERVDDYRWLWYSGKPA